MQYSSVKRKDHLDMGMQGFYTCLLTASDYPTKSQETPRLPLPALIVDYAMATPEINEGIAFPYVRAGCRVDYRPFYPNLVEADLNRYRLIFLLAGRTPDYPSGMMSAHEKTAVQDFVRNGGTLILAPNLEGGEGTNERYMYNALLADLGVQIQIGNEQVTDPEHQYAATLWERPFYQATTNHPVGENAPGQMAFERSVYLTAGAGTDVLLKSFPTAQPEGMMPIIAMAPAGNGLVVVAGRYILNAVGIPLRISGEPLVHPEKLEDTAAYLERLARYIVDLTRDKSCRIPAAISHEPVVLCDLPDDYVMDCTPMQRNLPEGETITNYKLPVYHDDIDGYDRKLAGHYAAIPDERRYGWIRNEGVRACWGSTVDWADMIKTKEDIERVADTLKAMDVNLFWGIAACQAVGGPGYSEEEKKKVLEQWTWTAEALDGSPVKWYPTLDYRYFREEKTRCLGAQGQKLEAPSPTDTSFWFENWRNSMLAMAEFSLDHPCIGGLCMDVELYGHPPAYNYYMGYGFEDECFYTALDRWQGSLDAALLKDFHELPIDERFNRLKMYGLLEAYFTTLSDEVARICRRIRDDIRKINPDLLIASYIFTTPCNWFDLGLYRGFSTPEEPVILMTFNVRSGRMMEHLRRREIYAYHTSVALLGMIGVDEYETVFSNASKLGHGYWMNNVNSLLTTNPDSVEAPARQGIELNVAIKSINEANQNVKAQP